QRGEAADGTAAGWLTAGQDDRSLDFGLRGTGTVGDLVWLDRDADGTPGDGEPPLGGVAVDVTWAGPDGELGTADDVAYRTTTGADGRWSVTGLPAGPVRVALDFGTLPAGTVPAAERDGAADGVLVTLLAAGGTDLGVDFGLAGTGTLGDLVWLDDDADGVAGPGEPGLPGVTVELRWPGTDGEPGTADDLVLSAVTGPDGRWRLTGLPAGEHRLVLDPDTLPSRTRPVADPGGDRGDEADGRARVTLAPGAVDLAQDFGLRGTASVGDRVWLDHDGDGTQDADEPPLGGIAVDVVWRGPDGEPGGDDDVVRRAVTDADGSWRVDGLPAGSYRVALDPATYPAGTVPVADPRPGAVDGEVALVLTGDALDLDFGLRGTGRVGDLVWLDTDDDGVRAPVDEPGVPGVTVQVTWSGQDDVLGTGDDLVVTVRTGRDGAWAVAGLPAGRLDVRLLAVPEALTPTSDEDSGTDEPDGVTVVVLAPGEEHLTADFGVLAATGVGDRVWLDLDADGEQDAGEPGLPGVRVTVTAAGADGELGTEDDVERTTTTGPTGAWRVTGLPGGPTRVALGDGLPAGVTPTADADGLDTPGVSVVRLVRGEVDDAQDFGYVGPGRLGDRVWVDVDRDGVQDDGEPGLPGVLVRVTSLGADGAPDGGDDVVVETVTDGDGRYAVGGLPLGEHRVEVAGGVPDGYAPTADEDAEADGRTFVTLDDEPHLSADFGYGGSGALGGLLWFDLDADGTRDEPAEPVTPGVPVEVVWAGPDGVLGTGDDVALATRTGTDGRWRLDGLPPGRYQVLVPPAALPPGVAVVFDRDDGTEDPDGVWTGDLGPTQERLDLDDGLRGSATLGDEVWVDQDRDGRRDAGEPGLPGLAVTVTWLGADGVLGGDDDLVFPTTTDDDGRYRVAGLPGGRYQVVLDGAGIPRPLSASADLDGGDPLVTAVELTAGQVRDDVDFVVVPPEPEPVPVPQPGGSDPSTGSGVSAGGDDDRPGGLGRTGFEGNGIALGGLLLTAAGALLLGWRRRRSGGDAG
ncbi:SdrD B-like domain-containing protein, partial [Microlunatus capsulatus]|uniref:SdrD B-like domain-containing protein n=1 Tax=Microlunatus capsulatus TaxID=99117 RepID=UPI0031D4E29E